MKTHIEALNDVKIFLFAHHVDLHLIGTQRDGSAWINNEAKKLYSSVCEVLDDHEPPKMRDVLVSMCGYTPRALTISGTINQTEGD